MNTTTHSSGLLRWRVILLISAIVVAVVTLPNAVRAAPQHTDPYWEAAYWDNVSLSGAPRVVRQETDLDHNWGYGSPGSGIPTDNFSARWTRYIDVTPATYRFSAASDDGIRLWVDGELIINQWYDHSIATHTADKALSAGHHLVTVEYYERGGVAAASVSWAPLSGGSQSWRGEYYNNKTLSGAPALVRDDRVVNFNWGYSSPAPGAVDSDGFSVRWTRTMEMAAGNHRFSLFSDDGVRLWVNGHLLIDAWKDQSRSGYFGDIYLRGGSVFVQLEYYENMGAAEVSLSYVQQDPSDWMTYNDTKYRVELQHPSNWQQTAADRFDGPDGFFMVGAMDAQSIDQAAQAEAYHVLRPYGSHPTIETTHIQGQEARVVWPSADQPTGMSDQTALIVRYPQPFQISGHLVRYFVLYVDAGHLHEIAGTLQFKSSPVIPHTVIVDNTDTNCLLNGLETAWHYAPEGYGGSLTWTRNNDYARSNYNWARWQPDLVTGRYEVFVYIPERYTTTSSARYWVSHQGGYTLRVIDQSANGSRWVSLGTYQFRGTTDDHVSLSDVTYEPYLSRLIAFDAVKWEPR